MGTRQNKTGNLLKQAGVFVEEVRMTLKNQTPRIVKIKAMKKAEPSISGVKYADDQLLSGDYIDV